MSRVAAENQLGAIVAKAKAFIEALAEVTQKRQFQVEQYEYLSDLLTTAIAAMQETACAPKAFEKVKTSQKLLERLTPDEMSMFGVQAS